MGAPATLERIVCLHRARTAPALPSVHDRSVRPGHLEALNRLLVERIAAHYPGATIEDDTAVFGDSGIQIRGQVHQVQDLGAQQAASLFMWISGGPFGSTPSFASVSGYHPDAATAVVEGACHWTCTLLDVLAVAGLVHLEGRPADPTGSRTSEVSIHGRPFTLVSSGFNRLFGSSSADPRDNFEAFRRQLGGDGSMSSVVAVRRPCRCWLHRTSSCCRVSCCARRQI